MGPGHEAAIGLDDEEFPARTGAGLTSTHYTFAQLYEHSIHPIARPRKAVAPACTLLGSVTYAHRYGAFSDFNAGR